ncbi:hypothetical protein [Achromobacter arsenitoxydans]|uniref:Uncharacterized protein n=1 Tax=Achromobacter arsenitoxydans SY8 TaxID=477184 RepID=H0F3T6_9BURK|nr:hypothetical protein [Achromobacter arsenitoxydans]EHK67050.1 hypothetical protein KYC_06746 [Achromobacter arsenitoxydans SY8]
MTAGVLAGSAAVAGTWYDFQDAYERYKVGQYSIARFYLLRSVTQFGAASLSVAIGLGHAGPFFEYLLKKYGARPLLGKGIKVALQVSAAMAARMAPMLRIFFGLNIAILALVVIEIFVLPNDLERFLDHCTFRRNRSNGIVDTEEKEIEIMQQAIKREL